MPNFTAGTSFSDGVTNDVTAAKLNALVADAVPTSNLSLNSTTGTIANFTSSTANITLGTIPTLTAGTTTSTNDVVTNGTITNLSATTSTFLGTITGSTNVVNIGSGQIYKDASGNVGIGITPSQKLDVNGASAIRGTLFLGDGSSSVIRKLTSSTPLTFANNGGSAEMTIDSSGNVGIGGTPSTLLHIQSTSPSLRIQAASGNSGVLDFYRTASVNSGQIASESTNALVFSTNGVGNSGLAERLRIDSSGNVRIGTTSFLGGGAQALSVKQNTDAWCMATQVTTNGNYGIVAVNASNTIVGGMIINASSTSFPTSSDYRLKTNLEPIVNGIERVKQLPVYSFNWKIDENGNKVDGFIAHEAKAIVPESVIGEKDAVDADGNPVYQGIDQSKIVPLLTAALKEAIAKIETLESKVTALEAA